MVGVGLSADERSSEAQRSEAGGFRSRCGQQFKCNAGVLLADKADASAESVYGSVICRFPEADKCPATLSHRNAPYTGYPKDPTAHLAFQKESISESGDGLAILRETASGRPQSRVGPAERDWIITWRVLG